MTFTLAGNLLQFGSQGASLTMGLMSLLTSSPQQNPFLTAILSPLISKTLQEIHLGELLCPANYKGIGYLCY